MARSDAGKDKASQGVMQGLQRVAYLSGKSGYTRDLSSKAIFSRQTLQTFHCLYQTEVEGDVTLASQKTQFNVLRTNTVCLSNRLLLDGVSVKLKNKFQGSYFLSVCLPQPLLLGNSESPSRLDFLY